MAFQKTVGEILREVRKILVEAEGKGILYM